MSNFDFGGGPGPGPTPPPAQLPPQPQQQFAHPGPGAPTQQAPAPSSPQQPAETGSGGTTVVGIISVLAILALVVGFAWLGNRFWPVRSTIDSAWRGLDGNAAELTSFLRQGGFTCSDENVDRDDHFHRLCAKFDGTSQVSIEFAGPVSGEIMRAYIEPQGRLTPEDTAAAERTIELSVPEQTAQARAQTALTTGPATAQEVTGAWGSAGWQDGVFTVARTWTAPTVAAHVPGDLAAVRARAEQQGYHCEDQPDALRCDRVANGAAWTFIARPALDPALLRSITFSARVHDRAALDPAEELEVVLPESPQRERMRWFVSTADQQAGQAGFARGVRVTYAVTEAEVVIDARTPCRTDNGVVSC